jgi:DNA-binding response OmpR family regulator
MPQDTEPLSGESQAAAKTILLVEDDPGIGSFLVEAITQETPYRAIVATDSHTALKLVRHFKPALFILDYGLPGMNGLELYDRLHINKELADLPAILITANRHLPHHLIQQRQLITFRKPFELDTFLAAIETLLTSS